MKRPTLDDLQREREAFIGPPMPPQAPKMARRLDGPRPVIRLEDLPEEVRASLMAPGDVKPT